MPDVSDHLETDFPLLISRDPYRVEGGQLIDSVQNDVLRYFNQAAQFHMDEELRNRFVSSGARSVPDKLRPIVSGSEAATFYRSLSVPYVAMTLEGSKDPAVKQLNIKRATRRLSDSMASSKVYHTQAQDFYALAWQEKFPEAGTYKDDQRQNSRLYRGKAEQALNDFIAQECADTDDNLKTLVRGLLKKYLALAQGGRYWAFRALLVFISEKNLATLDPVNDAHGDISDSANPMRKLLRQCAVLNALDDTGNFAMLLQDLVRHHLFSVSLANRVDLEANKKELGLICQELLSAFLAQTEQKAADYETMRTTVQHMLMVEQESQKQRATIIDFMVGVTSTGTTRSLSTWLNTTIDTSELSKLEVVQAYAGKGGVWLSRVVQFGALGTAVSNMIFMMLNGVSWSKLDGREKAGLIASGVDMFLMTAPRLVKVSVVTIPGGVKSFMVFWKSRSTPRVTSDLSVAEIVEIQETAVQSRALSNGSMLRSEKLGVQVEGGLHNWLTGEMSGTIRVTRLESIAAVEAGEKVTLVRRIFGKNLDHFMATRVGMVLAISGLALGIWGVATAKDNKDRWINIALTAASAMEICSVGIGMLGTAGMVGRIGSYLGPVGMAITIGIIGYMIYDSIFNQHSDSVIQQFVEGPAKQEGLFMEHGTDIDYLASSGSLSQGVGVTLASKEDTCLFLQLDLEDRPCAVVRKDAKAVDHDADTVFDLDVDGYGRITLISAGYYADARPEQDTPERLRSSTALVVSGTDHVTAGSREVLGDASNAGRWKAEMLKAPDTDGVSNAGEFTLRNDKTGMYLAVVGGAVVLSDKSFTWTVRTGVAMRKRFAYDTSNFNSITPDITLEEDQAGAKPIEWSAQGLPQFLSLGEDGTLRVDDATLAAADKGEAWRFSVTARNAGGSFTQQVELNYVSAYD